MVFVIKIFLPKYARVIPMNLIYNLRSASPPNIQIKTVRLS